MCAVFNCHLGAVQYSSVGVGGGGDDDLKGVLFFQTFLTLRLR